LASQLSMTLPILKKELDYSLAALIPWETDRRHAKIGSKSYSLFGEQFAVQGANERKRKTSMCELGEFTVQGANERQAKPSTRIDVVPPACSWQALKRR